jgi:hypothetical protein
VASYRQSGPIGIGDAPPAISGTLARTAPSFAGPIRSLNVPATSHAILQGTGDRRIASISSRWVRDWDGARPATTRGVVRLAWAGEWEAGCDRINFDTHESAQRTATLLVQNPVLAAELRSLSNVAGPLLISRTASQLHSGELKLLWRPRAQQIYAPVAVPAPPPAPVQRQRPAPSGPSAQYSTFPPDLDASAIAQSLKAAAQDGVPFCEECRKAQEARTSGEAA